MKFLDLFEPIQKGNFGLTDEAIYGSIQQDGDFIPVWGAYKEHNKPNRLIPEHGKTKYDDPITIFDGEGIIINFDGVSAGRMTYKKDERFALNHHAGFFKIKEQMKHSIIPEFFAIFYQTQLQNIAVSSDEKTLTMEMIYSMDFDVPQYDVQESIMSKIRPLLSIRQPISDTLERINHIKSRILSKKYENYQAMDVPISKVLYCMNGNTGLTEEAIYQTILLEGNRYIVLSSSTEERTKLGTVPIFSIGGKTIEVFEDKQGILVIRNGKAGTTVFLDKGKFTINDHAYILSLLDDQPYKISLKWIMVQHRHRFLEYSSSADNGTWNMTGFFDNVRIDIPSLEEQIGVVKQYDRLDNLEEKMKAVNSRISILLRKQLV